MNNEFIEISVLKNHLLLSLRRIRKNKLNTFINVLCIAAGISSFFLITLYVLNESSFNKSFDKADRIYRVTLSWRSLGADDAEDMAFTLPSLTEELKNYPEVEATVGIVKYQEECAVRVGEKISIEKNIYQAQNSYFKIFSHQWIAGGTETSLDQANSMVLTETLAKKYFNTTNCLNETLNVNGDDFIITGIIADLPHNTDLRFDAIVSFDRHDISSFLDWSYTYLLFRDEGDADGFQKKLDKLFNETVRPILRKAETDGRYNLEALSQIHFGPEKFGDPPKSRKENLYGFQAIGFLILVISTINYINLALAQSAKRQLEVGIKKIIGASTGKIGFQFVAESLIFYLISLMLAIFLIILLLPRLNDIISYPLSLKHIDLSLFILVVIGSLVLIVVGAGTYQAVYFAKLNPILNVKGPSKTTSKNNFRLKNILLTVQITASVSLIISSFVISKQIALLTKTVPSFNKEQVMVVDIPDDATMVRQFEELKNNVDILPFVKVTSLVGENSLPTSKDMFWDVYNVKRNGQAITKFCSSIHVDLNYFDLLGIEFIAGKKFSEMDLEADTATVIVNAALLDGLGWEDPVGKTIQYGQTDLKIIGVVKNFNENGLNKIIDPIIIYPITDDPKNLVIKLGTVDFSAIETIEELWHKSMGNSPFEFDFLDETFMRQFNKEKTMQSLINYFALLSIMISILGMFGILAINFLNKEKEFAVRKIFGADFLNILTMTIKDYVLVFVISISISIPIIIGMMNIWQQNFAYKAALTASSFALGYLIVAFLSVLVMLYHVIIAVNKNSIKGLNTE